MDHSSLSPTTHLPPTFPKIPLLSHFTSISLSFTLPSLPFRPNTPIHHQNIFLTTHLHHLTTHQLLITLINPNLTSFNQGPTSFDNTLHFHFFSPYPFFSQLHLLPPFSHENLTSMAISPRNSLLSYLSMSG